MRLITQFGCSALLALACTSASAQFGFSLPGFGGSKSGGLNIGSVVSNAVKATKDVPEDEEIRIGQDFAAVLLGAKGLDKDVRLQRYVNALGRWLSLQTERPDLPWTFGVLNDAGYNAFATPGGYVFVTRGLIDRMGSEAELAGVLAHEIGHVLKKHHLAAVKSNAGFALIGDVVGSQVKGGNEQLKNMIKSAVNKLYASGLDKGDEYEADRLGVVIAARAGYDAYGLPSVLQMLQSHNGQDNNFSLMFATHPSPTDRLATLDGLMKAQFDNLPSHSGKAPRDRLKEFARR